MQDVITPPTTKKPPAAVSWPGEPERKCGNCEHWRPIAKKKGLGECRNGISNLFITREASACARGWYPDVKRFPLHERLRVDQAPAKIASQTATIEQNSASATSSAAVESIGSPPVGEPKPASKRSRKS